MRTVQIGQYHVNPEQVQFIEDAEPQPLSRIHFGPNHSIVVNQTAVTVTRLLADEGRAAAPPGGNRG